MDYAEKLEAEVNLAKVLTTAKPDAEPELRTLASVSMLPSIKCLTDHERAGTACRI